MTQRASGPVLRATTPEDRAFLRGVYASTRSEELALVPWTASQKEAFIEHQFSAQDQHYQNHYPGATFDVITWDGNDVGRLYVHRTPHDLRIMDIALLPEYRGHGLGTALVKNLIEDAERSACKVSIHVERENRARGLYERLGFSITADHGAYWLLERPPVNQAKTAS